MYITKDREGAIDYLTQIQKNLDGKFSLNIKSPLSETTKYVTTVNTVSAKNSSNNTF